MRAMADTLVARSSESYVDPFKIAEAFARAESVDEAFYWLDKAVDDGSYEIIYLAFQPDFDVLRDDPRYQEMWEEIVTDVDQQREDFLASQDEPLF